MNFGEPVEEMTISTVVRYSSRRSKGTGSPSKRAARLDGALVGAVGDVDVACSGPSQVPRGRFRHLAGADDQNRQPVQVAEDLAGQLDGDVADRDRHLADAGLVADAPRHAERAVEQLVEFAAQGAGGLGQRVGVLHLAQNLRLADDHRIEARGYPKDVPHGVAVGVAVKEGRADLERQLACLAEELDQLAGRGRGSVSERTRNSTRLQVESTIASAMPGRRTSSPTIAPASCSAMAKRSRTSTGAVL